MGYYCPAGTGNDWQACPPGTFNNQTGLNAQSECRPCNGGYFCNAYGLSVPAGQCDPGYYCEFGLDRAQPTGGNATNEINGTCVLTGMC